MVNGGDLCLLNNIFPGLTECCAEFEFFSQDLTDVIDSAGN